MRLTSRRIRNYKLIQQYKRPVPEFGTLESALFSEMPTRSSIILIQLLLCTTTNSSCKC